MHQRSVMINANPPIALFKKASSTGLLRAGDDDNVEFYEPIHWKKLHVFEIIAKTLLKRSVSRFLVLLHRCLLIIKDKYNHYH